MFLVDPLIHPQLLLFLGPELFESLLTQLKGDFDYILLLLGFQVELDGDHDQQDEGQEALQVFQGHLVAGLALLF